MRLTCRHGKDPTCLLIRGKEIQKLRLDSQDDHLDLDLSEGLHLKVDILGKVEKRENERERKVRGCVLSEA